MRPVNRIQPALPVGAYKTFEVSMPVDTHWRTVSCAETECGAHRDGWWTLVDESTPLGRRQARYIRGESGRSFTESRDPSGGTRFIFGPGQTCFDTHKAPLDRPAIHSVRGGDWRGLVGERVVYDRGDQWQDDFRTQLERLRDAQT